MRGATAGRPGSGFCHISSERTSFVWIPGAWDTPFFAALFLHWEWTEFKARVRFKLKALQQRTGAYTFVQSQGAEGERNTVGGGGGGGGWKSNLPKSEKRGWPGFNGGVQDRRLGGSGRVGF